jgi:hypothetical protein
MRSLHLFVADPANEQDGRIPQTSKGANDFESMKRKWTIISLIMLSLLFLTFFLVSGLHFPLPNGSPQLQ